MLLGKFLFLSRPLLAGYIAYPTHFLFFSFSLSLALARVLVLGVCDSTVHLPSIAFLCCASVERLLIPVHGVTCGQKVEGGKKKSNLLIKKALIFLVRFGRQTA